MAVIIGIDQSKRSTAAVAIDNEGILKHFVVVAPAKEIDQEELLDYQWQALKYFLAECSVYHNNYGSMAIALEGLSFNAVGSGKDLLAGLFWYIRTMLYLERYLVGVIPVAAWRSKVLTKEEQKAIKALKAKDGVKKATVAKLPYEVKVRFEDYVREKGVKKEAIYDLADAYFIAQYRLSLDKK